MKQSKEVCRRLENWLALQQTRFPEAMTEVAQHKELTYFLSNQQKSDCILFFLKSIGMSLFVPIRNCSFVVSKILYQKGFGVLSHYPFRTHIYKGVK